MRRIVLTVLISAAAFPSFADLASEFAACKAETDSLKRLTCFDAISSAGGASAAISGGSKAKLDSSPIELTKATLRVQEKDFQRQVFNRRVELHPTFKNGSKKTLVAVEHTLQIHDAFGALIVNITSQLDIKIGPGKTAESDTFYLWEDNPFISDEPFDKLQGPVSTGVAKATLQVTKAVFSDGSVESY